MSQTTTGQVSSAKQVAEELKASFEVTTGGRNKTFLIHKPRVVIGSVESADVKITENGVAPIHAVVEFIWNTDISKCEAKILDLASPTGVIINGQKVIHQTLKNGDSVQVGDATFVFNFKKPEPKSLLPDQALLLIDSNSVEAIFDYRPDTKDTLEVVYSWNESILNVEHFTSESYVTVPGVYQNGNELQLAQKTGNSWTLNLKDQMTGVVYIGGEVKPVSQLRKTASTITLGQNDFAKIESGAVSFYLSQTAAPPMLVKRAKLINDPFLFKSLILSIIFTMLTVGALQFFERPNEQVQVPETIATILYHPEMYSSKKPLPIQKPKEEVKKAETPPEPEKPKKAEVDFTKPKETEGKVAQTKSPQPGKKQSAQSQSKEGEGARAKGAEGSRGAKNAKPSNTKQNAANRPSPNAGNDRGGTKSEVADNGNVQMMKGATNKILDLLGGSGQKLGKSGSKLSGFGGFSTEGNGGLALAGKGKGGGGNADTLLGGLGDKGRGGGKVGTGLGAEGTGSGIVGGKTRVELNVGGGTETVVVGAIDRDAIEAAIRAHRDEFRNCYEREINAGAPSISGKVFTAFVIGASGKASQLSIASSTINSPNVDRCVLSVLGRIQFPLPAGGVPVTIKYPFNFANASK